VKNEICVLLSGHYSENCSVCVTVRNTIFYRHPGQILKIMVRKIVDMNIR